MKTLNGLLYSRKFWLAVVGVVATVVLELWPDFPREIWLAIDTLIIAVIAGITIEDSAEKLSYRNQPKDD
jgi:hypothetical protein